MQDPESKQGQLTVDVLEMCFAMLPRIQLLDVQASRVAQWQGASFLVCKLPVAG